jgi:hypothetical protein
MDCLAMAGYPEHNCLETASFIVGAGLVLAKLREAIGKGIILLWSKGSGEKTINKGTTAL